MTPPLMSTRVLTAAQIGERSDLLGWILVAIGALLWIGWTIVLLREARTIWESQARFGYFLADVLIVAPGCLVSGIGVLEERGWGAPMLLLTAGAATYDLTHFIIYLFQAEVPKLKGKGLAWWFYAPFIVIVWGGLAYVAREAIKIAQSVQISMPPAFVPILGAVAVAVLILALSLRRRRPPGPWPLSRGLRGW